MHHRHLHPALSSIVILLAIVACVLPSHTAPSLPSSNEIETAIVGTIQAATAAAQSIATKTPEGPTGTIIEPLPDGIAKYTDYDAGFEITFPTGWLTVRPNSEEFDAALAGEAAANSLLHDQMTSDLSISETEHQRLFSYILRPDIQKKFLFGFAAVRWLPEDSATLDSVNMGRAVRELETSGDLPGFRVDTAQIHVGDLTMIEIGGRWTMSDGKGTLIPFYATFYVFKPTPNSTVRILFAFLEDYKVKLVPDIVYIVQSIKVTKK